jgi:RNA polymerase sigma factor (sigma-70 family)
MVCPPSRFPAIDLLPPARNFRYGETHSATTPVQRSIFISDRSAFLKSSAAHFITSPADSIFPDGRAIAFLRAVEDQQSQFTCGLRRLYMAFANAMVVNEKGSVGNFVEVKLQLQLLDEARLVAEAKRGESEAFDELWRAYSKGILKTTYRITRNREDAEDALQDSFLSAFANIHAFDGKSRFSTWLMRIAINASLMIVRKKRTALELSLDDRGADGDWEVAVLLDRTPDPETQFVQRERAEILRQAIGALRPSIRRAVELQKLGEHSVQETAAKMGLTVTAAKSRLNQAKAALRESLNPKASRLARNTRRFHLLPAA